MKICPDCEPDNPAARYADTCLFHRVDCPCHRAEHSDESQPEPPDATTDATAGNADTEQRGETP